MRVRAGLLAAALLAAMPAGAQPPPARPPTAAPPAAGPVAPGATAPAPPRAAAAAGPSFAARALAALPAEIGGLRREGAVADLEARPGGAGLGASARLVPADGAAGFDASLFFYDRGDARRPEGVANPDVAPELREAVAEIAAAIRRGLYRDVAPGRDLLLGAGADGRPAARCVTFRVTHRNGGISGNAVCVTVHRAHFLKSRFTLWGAEADDLGAGLRAAALLVQARDHLR